MQHQQPLLQHKDTNACTGSHSARKGAPGGGPTPRAGVALVGPGRPPLLRDNQLTQRDVPSRMCLLCVVAYTRAGKVLGPDCRWGSQDGPTA